MKRFRFPLCIAFLLFAAGSCTHSVEPPESFTRQITVEGPKSGLADLPYSFTAKINFNTTAKLEYVWSMGDSILFSAVSNATTILSFHNPGVNVFRVRIFDASNNIEIAESVDTFVVQAGFAKISPDSLRTAILTRNTYTATFSPELLKLKHTLVWFFDSTREDCVAGDTASCAFSATGQHVISVAFVDTAGQVRASGSAVTFVSAIPLSILASPTSTTVLSPVVFTAIFPAQSFPVQIRWDFGDGSIVDTALSVITHRYSFTGRLMLKAYLYHSGVLLGSDSIAVQITPLLVGYDPSLLPSFRRATALFSGSFLVVGEAGPGPCGGFSFESDSLTWKGTRFSYGTSYNSSSVDTSQGPANETESSSSGSTNFSGNISSDGMTLDTLTASSESVSNSQGYHNGGSFYQDESDGSSLQGFSIQLIWFTPDSIRYGITGTNIGDHAGFSGNCHFESSHPYIATNMSYRADWSRNASVIVTFYKR